MAQDQGDPKFAAEATRLAIESVEKGWGGPFGAVVFDATTNAIVAVGANWVVAQRSSLLHAEIAAIAFAQARLESHTLGGGVYELVASSEPCAQCLGATAWSGVRRLLCGAAASDAEAIGSLDDHDGRVRARNRARQAIRGAPP